LRLQQINTEEKLKRRTGRKDKEKGKAETKIRTNLHKYKKGASQGAPFDWS